ncbi:MAG: glycosyltransferase [Desulfitobacteriaceae bacterium]|nr:glycosyltransferase [Desulfitobacteriaceae bacterium]MDD4346243.1 glycosyltransferase [Desulfitobacteriaceae bacterium]MDD4400287.1 glycosyltransferase [Desulfitobacteriaceae bacterium]
MFSAVIPAQNEEKSILAVLTNLLVLPLDLIIPVLNGCTDNTLELIHSIPDPRLHIIYFTEPLGIDIPRAIGALYALKLKTDGVLFIDGDMSGNIYKNLNELLKALSNDVDIALTNCYPYITHRTKLANLVIKFRFCLNKELNLLHTLGLATPTHGPHALSARALALLPPESLAIPPLSLVYGKKNNLKVKVATSIPHHDLLSPSKHRRHARFIAQTIIGDCLMALASVKNQPLTRTLGKHELLGYHPERRFDLLQQWSEALQTPNTFIEQHLIIAQNQRLLYPLS